MTKKPVEQRTHKASVMRTRTSGVARTCNHPQRAARQASAAASQAAWRMLTIDQQLAELKARPGECKKQVARLTKLKSSGLTHAGAKALLNAVKPDGDERAGDTHEKASKAPPKSDLKATKSFKKKQGKE